MLFCPCRIFLSPHSLSSRETLRMEHHNVTSNAARNFLLKMTLFNGRSHTPEHTWCGRKLMRLAKLCTNRQCCCLPLHMAVRLTPAVDAVQVWTCYSCYAIDESVWSEVVFVRCVTKMDRQKIEQSCAIKFCVKLGESATVTYEKL